jgi:hypothetical protein
MAANSVRTKGAKASRLETERKQTHQRALKIASELALRAPPKIDDSDAFLVTTKLLNRHTYQICTMEEANSPSLVQNVRILRPERSKATKFGAVPFRSVYG